jgi:hydroxymethylbilane synthase
MSESDKQVLRLGARGSMLSRVQSQSVADELEKLHEGLKIELVVVKTSGDQIADRPLHEYGGKGLFTREIEMALLENRVDVAVHSFKDVPVTMPLVAQEGLTVAAVPKRANVRDVLISKAAGKIEDLPKGARVGTGSLRRQAQLLAMRPDLRVEMIRGNIDTRLKKLREGEFDAIVLAMAGLTRSGLYDSGEMTAIEPEVILPAAGQGALCIQCRLDDQATRGLLAKMNDPATELCVKLEREVVRRLAGDCHSPIGAYAVKKAGQITLTTAVAAREGRPPVIRASAQGSAAEAESVVDTVMTQLLEQGAAELLKGN